MKQLLVLAFVLALASCGTQSTEIKTDSTATIADTTAVDTTTKLVDTAK